MKKQNLIKQAIGFLVVILTISFFSNCEKTVQTSYEDFSNPMESIGVIHNEGLDYILDNYSGPTGSKISDKELLNLTGKYMSFHKGNKLVYNETINYNDLGNIVIDKLKNADIKSISYVSFTEKYQTHILLEELFSLVNEKKSISPSEFFDEVKKLEFKIYESDLPEEDKYLLLTSCSVGKHSFKYWSDYLRNNRLDKKGGLKEDLINADIEGSIVGAIGGGIIGAIYGSVLMPGVGTITAAILEGVHGGIYGAVLSSSFRALKELF